MKRLIIILTFVFVINLNAEVKVIECSWKEEILNKFCPNSEINIKTLTTLDTDLLTESNAKVDFQWWDCNKGFGKVHKRQLEVSPSTLTVIDADCHYEQVDCMPITGPLGTIYFGEWHIDRKSLTGWMYKNGGNRFHATCEIKDVGISNLKI